MINLRNYYLVLSTFFIFILLLIPTDDLDAQRRGKKKRRPKTEEKEDVASQEKNEETIEWKDRLWYGGGFGLGFGGNSLQSQFFIEISPMVGYKFNKWFSVGPRISLTYVNGRIDLPPVEKYNIFNYGIGVFARFKPINQLFIHGEWGYENRGYIPLYQSNLEVLRESRTPLLFGIGYSAGGPGITGYEILLLYDFSAPDNTLELPIVYRIGFNYNF